MNDMQSPLMEPMVDRAGGNPETDQLSPGNDAVLSFGSRPDQPIRTKVTFTPVHWSDSTFVRGHGPRVARGGARNLR
jgi:hypothetical protein